MIISNYKAIFNKNTERMKAPYRPGQKCPDCHNIMKVRDSKKRGPVATISENKINYQVRRYYCKQCQKLHVELPGDLAPYMRHDVDVIQHAIESNMENSPGVEDSTIRRWRGIFLTKIKRMAASAGIEAPQKGSGGRWLAEIIKKIYDAGKKHTHNAYIIPSGGG